MIAMTPTETAQVLTVLILAFGAIGGGLWKLVDRHDRRSMLSTALEEAEKTVKSQGETIAAKNDEIRDWARRNERLEDRLDDRERRIDELEDRLYGGGRR